MNNLGVGGMTEWQTDAFRTSMVRKLEEAIKVTDVWHLEQVSKMILEQIPRIDESENMLKNSQNNYLNVFNRGGQTFVFPCPISIIIFILDCRDFFDHPTIFNWP